MVRKLRNRKCPDDVVIVQTTVLLDFSTPSTLILPHEFVSAFRPAVARASSCYSFMWMLILGDRGSLQVRFRAGKA